MSDAAKRMALAIIAALRGDQPSFDESRRESIEVAIQCICEAYDVAVREIPIHKPPNLRLLLAAHREDGDMPRSSNIRIADDVKKQAEALKAKGNDLLSSNPSAAVESYSRAIDLLPDNAIYFANRAAAYLALRRFHDAVQDCQKAIAIDPSYTKAYSRLATSYVSLKRFDDAERVLRSGLEIEPDNATLKAALEGVCKNRSGASHAPMPSASNVRAGTAPSPTGGPDFSSLLNNPGLMQMASQMMQSGNFEGVMNNPLVAQMLSAMGGSPATSPAASAPAEDYDDGETPASI